MDLREVACGSHKSILLVDSPGINQCRRGCIQLIHSVFKDNLLNVFLAFWQTVHLRQKEHVLDEVKRADYVMFLMKAFAAKAFPGKETKLFCIDGKTAEKAIKAGGQHDEQGCQELECFLEEKLAGKNRQLW
ncbi:unnamed protein product [Durusdinium trenchii]|uniref:AIG1-type G domain-containing protein n=1 Tax=Durusdinium trenchii TaxID=1381693 RepID=A0ABP0HZ45_9DINO